MRKLMTQMSCTASVVLTSHLACTPSEPRFSTTHDSSGSLNHIPDLEPRKYSFLSDDAHLYWIHPASTLDKRSLSWLETLGEDRYRHMYAVGIPEGPSLRLVVSRHERTKPISWPSDLVGFVDIDTAGKAKEFVMLFSSPQRFYRFPNYGYLAIQPSKRLVLFRNPGDIDASVFGDLPITQIVEDSQSFRILRTVADTRSRNWHLAVIDETVTKNGEYALRVLWKDDKALDRKAIYLNIPQ